MEPVPVPPLSADAIAEHTDNERRLLAALHTNGWKSYPASEGRSTLVHDSYGEMQMGFFLGRVVAFLGRAPLAYEEAVRRAYGEF